MITYQNTRRRPAAFNSLFGFSVAAFDALFLEFAPAHQDRLAASDVTRKHALPRQRKVGAGRKFRHDLRDRLLLALFWLRVYPTLEVLGFFFSLDKTSAEDNLKDILATLEAMTSFALEHPDKTRRKLRTVAQVMDAFPDVAVVIDAKEQRLAASEEQKDCRLTGSRGDRQRLLPPRRKRAETLLLRKEEMPHPQNSDWRAS